MIRKRVYHKVMIFLKVNIVIAPLIEMNGALGKNVF
jgi:hypothetical protein